MEKNYIPDNVFQYRLGKDVGTADIFRGIMVSLYVKGKENGHVISFANINEICMASKHFIDYLST